MAGILWFSQLSVFIIPFMSLLRKTCISVMRESPEQELVHELKMQFGLNFRLKESGNTDRCAVSRSAGKPDSCDTAAP